MPATHLVLRRIAVAEGRDIFAGTAVDASSWRNLRLLEEEGYVRRLRDDEVADVPPAPAVVDVHEVGSTVAADAEPVASEPIRVDVLSVNNGVADVRVTVDPAALKPKPKASKKKRS